MKMRKVTNWGKIFPKDTSDMYCYLKYMKNS